MSESLRVSQIAVVFAAGGVGWFSVDAAWEPGTHVLAAHWIHRSFPRNVMSARIASEPRGRRVNGSRNPSTAPDDESAVRSLIVLKPERW
ncbi:hypothetical protein ACL02S_15725 [Nocardia sp. 004]|uniref:hypothetical protein n=1 Tax=Nocardia sp. 004 TaxID=3385978 RepID=UPI00399F5432